MSYKLNICWNTLCWSVSQRVASTWRPDGKFLFKNNVFFSIFTIFYWFLSSWLRKIDFAKFSRFCIFTRGVKKIIASLLAYESSFLLDQMIGLGCLVKSTQGFLIIFTISISNLRKTLPNHISASNRKFYPKGVIRQR